MPNTRLFFTIICITLIAGAELYSQDAENVEQVGRLYNQWDCANGVVIVGDLAYIATGISGLQILNISDPENPEIIGYWDDNPGIANSVTVSGDYAYVAYSPIWISGDPVGGGLRVVDITDPENPEEVGFYDTPVDAIGVTVSGDYAYVADYENGLRVVDITDPENPEEVGYYDTPGSSYDVIVSGGYAYIADHSCGLRVVDITDPENPEEIGYYDTPGYANGVTVSGGYAYVVDGWQSGLRVVDITDPENPEEVGYYDTPGYARGVTVSGDYTYVADGGSGLRVVDITDPENPEEVGYFDTPGTARGVTVSSGYAYVTDSRYVGLRVVDITDPENPEEVGYYDTPGEAFGVALSEDGLIYVADVTNVGIYRFTDPAKADDSFILHPSAFILHPAYPNPFNSSATIRYGLSTPCNVSLEVYSPLGQKITKLFAGFRQAGFYSTNLTANNLPSGLYLLRLEAADQVFTQKIMLVR
ncbi:MAG: T9SS type A sorting domain-containing protein [Candidatus Hatepunaea meridiana]|nr:T9SS type A sorting domain-containing protein [Candidatus Hatepunaea meridiana]